MAMDEKLVDKRVVRRNLERGRIDAAAYRGMLESLPDASQNVDRTEAAALALSSSGSTSGSTSNASGAASSSQS